MKRKITPLSVILWFLLLCVCGVGYAQPVVTITTTQPHATEWGTQSANFILKRSGGTNVALTVGISLQGTAVNGTDYETLALSYTIPRGAFQRIVEVKPKLKSSFTATSGVRKTLQVSLLSSSSYSRGNPQIVDLTVSDRPYTTWRYHHFTGDQLQHASSWKLADPDGDKIPNLFEYAFGTEPKVINANTNITVQKENDFLTLTAKVMAEANDLDYLAEISSDLTNWVALPENSLIADHTNGKIRTLKWRDTQSSTKTSKRFIRLNIDLSTNNPNANISEPIQSQATVVLYPGPQGVTASSDFTMRVNGKNAFVYGIKINPTQNYEDTEAPASMAYFDFQGTVQIELTTKRALTSAVVRPLSKGITPTIQGNKITFTLSKPGNFSVELNGNRNHPLFLFANPLQTQVPKPNDANIRYFGPGVHNVGKIELKANQTLYLAGGAFVNGYVRAVGADNMKIRGRGILHGGKYVKGQLGQKFIMIYNSKNIALEGFISLDAPEWNINPVNCHGVLLDNVKAIGWRKNSDALDPVNCTGLTVRNCYFKTQDDGITLKGREIKNSTAIKNILVENTTIWQNWMRAMVVGGELHGISEFSNIIFRNSDITYSGTNRLSADNRDAALSVWNVDDAVVDDVLFENIRVEEADRLVRLAIVKNKFSATAKYGKIRNITFRNITCIKGKASIELSGYSNNHLVENITFENLRIGGKLIRSAKECNYVANAYVKNVKFIVTQ